MIQHQAPSFLLEPIFPGPVPISIFNFHRFSIFLPGHSSDHVTAGVGGHLYCMYTVQCTVQGQLPPLQGVMPRLRPDNEPHNNWVSHFDCLKEISHFAPQATDTVGDVKTGIVSDFTRPSAGGTGL